MYRLILVCLLLLLLPSSATAQLELELELRGGMAVGSHSTTYAGLELHPRPSFNLMAKIEWWEHSIFIDGSYASFGCADEGFCVPEDPIDVRQMSVAMGLELSRSLAWARLGGGFGKTAIGSVSGFGPALVAGTGVRLESGPWGLTPGVSYRWMRSGDSSTVIMSADIGLTYRLGDTR